MPEPMRKNRDLGELLVLALVPGIVAMLVAISWALAHWKIGPAYISNGVALVAILFGGYLRFVSAVKDILRRKITVSVFVAVALVATVAVGEFRAAAIVVFIMSVASALESYTLDKTRKSIRELLDLAPKTATVRRDGREQNIPLTDVRIGDTVLVGPGGRIPVDGVVTAGVSGVNQAPITGESLPVEKAPGSEVFSGTLVETGRLEIRVTRVGKDTTLARIVHMTEQAQATKAPVQGIADRFTTWFFPTILLLAILGFVISGDVKIAVSVLLVACPCAFAIATPTAVTGGISNLARKAILVKGGVYLETASKLDTLLVDKTGTFTVGRPMVTEVLAFGGHSQDEVLAVAASAEKRAGHPLSRAVLDYAAERGVDVPDPEEFKVEVGMGVVASCRGRSLVVGKADLLHSRSIAVGPEANGRVCAQAEMGRTVMLVAADGAAIGAISIADQIRPGTADVLSRLRKAGIRKITMLTGDNPGVAAAVAKEIGVDDFKAGLLPEDKLEIVKGLQAQGLKVGMIGDGINDAPALAQADVGIAMGAAGTDVAIETAGVTLMSDDLAKVIDFIQMSKKVITRIKLNIFFSIIYNAVGLTLSLMGLMTPILAVTFQEAGCLTVVLSSTLLLWAKTSSDAR